MDVYKLVRSGVHLTLTEYAQLPARQRQYLILWNEVVEPKRQGLVPGK